jgi:SOS-response transcriptional repressor LexA
LAEAVEFLQVTLLGPPVPTSAARLEPNVLPLRRRVDIPREEQMLGARLVFRAIGTSMADAGIAEGDLVFIKPTRDLREADGSLIVCRLGTAEYLKELQLRGHCIRLLSRNERYTAIEVNDNDDFSLIGVVVGQARRRR